MSRSLLLAALAVSVSAPAAANCLKNGVADTCQYPPFQDDFGPVTATSGLDDGSVPAVGTPLRRRLHRVTLTGSDSVCNDGSPAVMYVREAWTTAADSKWLIVLEGGGTGFNPSGSLDDGMWNRWTGGGSNPLLNWYKKASTDWRTAGGAIGRDGVPDVPMELVFPGILDGGMSTFRDWNLVFVNYCSSDSWMGQASGVELYAAGTWTDSGDVWEGFKMDFHGRDIVADVISMLDDPTAWGTDADPTYAMPDIDAASVVLLAGESAGGGGVLNNLDFVEAELSTINPGVTVLGSIGATHKPHIATPFDSWWLDAYPVFGQDDIQDGAIAKWSQVGQISGVGDASCAASGATWECLLLAEAEPFLSTPFHVKQDMSDSLVSSAYNALSDYQDGITSDYATWAAAGSPPHFAPDCGRHESLTSTKYHDHVLQLREDLGGGAVGAVVFDEISYDEALRRFVAPGLADEFVYDGLTGTLGGVSTVWVSDCP